MSMHRRDFLRTMCLGGVATYGAPLARFAHVPVLGMAGERRLVFVLLRGGFDGLHALVPAPHRIGDALAPSRRRVTGLRRLNRRRPGGNR